MRASWITHHDGFIARRDGRRQTLATIDALVRDALRKLDRIHAKDARDVAGEAILVRVLRVKGLCAQDAKHWIHDGSQVALEKF